jgi:hypothetical protein
MCETTKIVNSVCVPAEIRSSKLPYTKLKRYHSKGISLVEDLSLWELREFISFTAQFHFMRSYVTFRVYYCEFLHFPLPLCTFTSITFCLTFLLNCDESGPISCDVCLFVLHKKKKKQRACDYEYVCVLLGLEEASPSKENIFKIRRKVVYVGAGFSAIEED